MAPGKNQERRDVVQKAREDERKALIQKLEKISNDEKQLFEDAKYNVVKRVEIVKLIENEIPDYISILKNLEKLKSATYSNLGAHARNLREFQKAKDELEKLVQLGITTRTIIKEDLIKAELIDMAIFDDLKEELDQTMQLLKTDTEFCWKEHVEGLKDDHLTAIKQRIKRLENALFESGPIVVNPGPSEDRRLKRPSDATGGICHVEIEEKRQRKRSPSSTSSRRSSSSSSSSSDSSISSISSQDSTTKDSSTRQLLHEYRYLASKGSKQSSATHPCTFCRNKHFSDSCPEYPDYSTREARMRNKCHMCLFEKHPHRNCQQKPCYYCRSVDHNRAMCPHPTPIQHSSSQRMDSSMDSQTHRQQHRRKAASSPASSSRHRMDSSNSSFSSKHKARH